ncbi:MAG: GFA family protein [Pikeienuella sp.]
MSQVFTGSCHCGGVAYSAQGPLRDVICCHCSQCRKTSGHYVAATSVKASGLTLIRDDTLTWYNASDTARRGFCNRCGGNLFWKPVDRDDVSIFAGTLDGPTGLTSNEHIFAQDKGDYYDLPEGALVRSD